MDKVGRRIFFLIIVIGMCVFFVVFGVYFEIYIFLEGEGLVSEIVFLFGLISYFILVKKIFWLLILCIVLFNLMFVFVWGFVLWFVMLEIFFFRVRGLVSSFAIMVNWILVFIVIKIY